MRHLFLALLFVMLATSGFPQNKILPLWEGDPPNYRETGEVTIWDTSDIVRVRLVQQPDIVGNSIVYYKALLKHQIPAELHIYPYGGHGYSLAIGQGHLSTWPDRVYEWIKYLHE